MHMCVVHVHMPGLALTTPCPDPASAWSTRYYFFLDPPRFLNLLDVEFAIYQGALQGSFLIHFLLSWYFRDRYYRLYLRVKHWVKNRTVWRRASYGDVESEPLAKKKAKSSSRT